MIEGSCLTLTGYKMLHSCRLMQHIAVMFISLREYSFIYRASKTWQTLCQEVK